jgi:chromosome segregation ATPase
MKNKVCFCIAMLVFVACNNSEKDQKIKDLSAQDSTLLKQTLQKDSTITAYIHTMNDIQDNLDTIKAKEKFLAMRNEGKNPNAVTDIKALGDLIIKDNKEINRLSLQLKKMGKKDADLETMVAHLSQEIADKEAELTSLQFKYAAQNDSLKYVVRQFNDTMTVIDRQRADIANMTVEIHTVYYAIGTMKELKKQGVITKEGGIVGLGSTAKLKKNFNTAYFTKADMTQLHVLPLDDKFVKLVTDHPDASYKIQGNTKTDSLVITDPNAFWSDTKYMVVVVK